MSSAKSNGLKAPSAKMVKPSGLPQPRSSIPTPGSSRSHSPEPLPPSKPTDDYIIGDRVWVCGTKPGNIAFIGETQFAPGEWVGVVLDEAAGKNDGSVAGVRYFQCEMKRGVFARIAKISRTPEDVESASSSSVKPSRSSDVPATTRQSLPPAHGNDVTPPSSANSTTKLPKFSMGGSLTTSTSSLNKSGASSAMSKSSTGLNKPNTGAGVSKPNAASLPHAGINTSLKIGDRIMVSGTKSGTLRFLGTTEFSKGVWCGVELDEALGKNDGAVAGKRYFTCKPLYGLFSPIHKVTRISVTTPPLTTPRTSRVVPATGRLSRQRSGSQDSISSISSTASSVSRSRMKSGRAGATPTSATTSALQKALKEKDEHIEQLLKERELERSEVARAAAQVEESESELVKTKSELEHQRVDFDEMIRMLQATIQEKEREVVVAQGKLDEEKRKVEDLQFEIAEESICKDDIESKPHVDDGLVTELQQDLTQARAKISALNLELDTLKSSLGMKQTLVTELETSVADKNNQIHRIEQEMKEMKSCVKSEETKMVDMRRIIDALTSQLQDKDTLTMSLQSEIQELKSQLTDLKHLLEESNHRASQLSDDNAKQERQLREMMASTGNDNEQLRLLTERIADRDRELEETRAALSSSIKEANKHTAEQIELNKQNSLKHQADLTLLTEKKDSQIYDLSQKLNVQEDIVFTLQEEIQEKSSRIELLAADKISLEEQKNQMQELYDKIRMENQRQNEVVTTMKDELITSEMVNTTLKDEYRLLETKIRDIERSRQQDQDKLTSQHKATLEAMKRDHIERMNDAEMKLQESKKQLNLQSHDLDTLRADFQKAQEENSLQKQQLITEAAKGDEMQKSINMSQSQLVRLESEKSELSACIHQLQQQHAQLEAANTELSSRLKESHEQRVRETEGSESARRELETSLSTAQSTIVSQNAQLERLNTRIADVERENGVLNEFKASCQKLENEQFELYEKIASLEASLAESHPETDGSMSGEPAVNKNEKEDQIEFLNSVIADIQRKYDKAKVKIRALERVDMVNGADSSFEKEPTSPRTAAPRLFCDICDVFDQHDTEDCPLQAMSDSPPASHYSGSRDQERPYCDTCESFLPIGEISCRHCITADDDYAKRSHIFRQFLFDSDIEYWSDPSPRISPIPPQLEDT